MAYWSLVILSGVLLSSLHLHSSMIGSRSLLFLQLHIQIIHLDSSFHWSSSSMNLPLSWMNRGSTGPVQQDSTCRKKEKNIYSTLSAVGLTTWWVFHHFYSPFFSEKLLLLFLHFSCVVLLPQACCHPPMTHSNFFFHF